MRQLAFLLLIPLLGLATGCASSRSAEEAAADRAAAIGTWRYQVTGSAPLHRGVFHISLQNGRLQGLVRDQLRGRLSAQVNVRDSRMELTLGQFSISGIIEDETFTGFLRRQQYDVSTPYPRKQSRRRSRTAPLYAHRIQSAAVEGAAPPLECESILREANGCP